jgi:Protein of unknown function (DUF3489)
MDERSVDLGAPRPPASTAEPALQLEGRAHQKRLASCLKGSIGVVVTLRPVDPGLVLVRGRIGRAPETKGQAMSIKLTDTQLLTLSAAAQRQDHCIVAPPNLKGAAAQKFAAKLVAAGLVEEIRAKPSAHVWRRDDATGEAYALKLTTVGLKTIRVEETEAVEALAEISATPGNEGQRKPKNHDGGRASVPPATVIATPRDGSKLSAVVGLLRREGGATIDQLAAAMGWLPHTTRAALTGLRKRGFEIDRRKAKDAHAGSYVVLDNPTAAER